MPNVEAMQAAVDEIREVCRKRGVVLLGTCVAEGIYGEILIAPAVRAEIGWSDPERALTNHVETGRDGRDLFVCGIGDLREDV